MQSLSYRVHAKVGREVHGRLLVKFVEKMLTSLYDRVIATKIGNTPLLGCIAPPQLASDSAVARTLCVSIFVDYELMLLMVQHTGYSVKGTLFITNIHRQKDRIRYDTKFKPHRMQNAISI